MINSELQAVVRDCLAIPNGVELKEDLSPRSCPSWDSLQHMVLITMIEETFEIVFDAEDIQKMGNLGMIDRVVAIKRGLRDGGSDN